mmetsp:Transcript_90762/g.252479  ORF Transcript_90762/g.252479 Transcript_90762/m.252479 type:complete len:227 (+) Transcript_90762:2607-3287(+)
MQQQDYNFAPQRQVPPAPPVPAHPASAPPAPPPPSAPAPLAPPALFAPPAPPAQVAVHVPPTVPALPALLALPTPPTPLSLPDPSPLPTWPSLPVPLPLHTPPPLPAPAALSGEILPRPAFLLHAEPLTCQASPPPAPPQSPALVQSKPGPDHLRPPLHIFPPQDQHCLIRLLIWSLCACMTGPLDGKARHPRPSMFGWRRRECTRQSLWIAWDPIFWLNSRLGGQ